MEAVYDDCNVEVEDIKSVTGILQPNFLKIEQRFADVYDVLPMLELLETPSDDWLCTNCRQLLVRAYNACCGHRFCGRCVDSLVIKAKRSCPVDHQPIFRHSLVRQVAEKKIELRVHCIRVLCPYRCGNECFVIDLLTHKLECSEKSKQENDIDRHDPSDESYVRVLGIFEEKLDAMHRGIQGATKLIVELKALIETPVIPTIASSAKNEKFDNVKPSPRTKSADPRGSTSATPTGNGRSKPEVSERPANRNERRTTRAPPLTTSVKKTSTTGANDRKEDTEVRAKQRITRGATTVSVTKQNQVVTRSLTTVRESSRNVITASASRKQTSTTPIPTSRPVHVTNTKVKPRSTTNCKHQTSVSRGSVTDQPIKCDRHATNNGNDATDKVTKPIVNVVALSNANDVTDCVTDPEKESAGLSADNVTENVTEPENVTFSPDSVTENVTEPEEVTLSPDDVTKNATEPENVTLSQDDVTENVTEPENFTHSPDDVTNPEKEMASLHLVDLVASEPKPDTDPISPSDVTQDEIKWSEGTVPRSPGEVGDDDAEFENEVVLLSQRNLPEDDPEMENRVDHAARDNAASVDDTEMERIINDLPTPPSDDIFEFENHEDVSFET